MGTEETTARSVDANVSFGICCTPISKATASLIGDRTKLEQVTRSSATNPIQVDAGAFGRKMRASG